MNRTQRIQLLLVSSPGLVCDATCITVAVTDNVQLVAIASGALTATQLLHRVQSDMILVDSSLPETEAIAFIHWLAEQQPSIPCLVATTTSAQIDQAINAGASVAVRREELPTALHQFVRDFAQGRTT